MGGVLSLFPIHVLTDFAGRYFGSKPSRLYTLDKLFTLGTFEGKQGMIRRYSPGVIVCIVLAVLIVPVSAFNTGINTITPGGDVFIGEEGLDISSCIGNATTIAWFESGSNPAADVPSYIMDTGDPGNFYVSPSTFGTREGLWYQWSGSSPAGPPAFNCVDPYLETGIISQGTGNTVSYGEIPQGDFLNFYISSNMWTVCTRAGYNESENGIFDIKVTSPDGIVYSALFQNSTYSIPLRGVSVNSSYQTWVPSPPPYNENGWNTGLVDPSGTHLYKSGLYEVTVETDLNHIMDNYRDPDGGDYIGKTVAYPQPVTIGSGTLAITASRTSIVRGDQFSITLKGMPSTQYIVWVKNTGQMTGLSSDQPPYLLPYQSGLRTDPVDGPYQFGEYQFQGGNGRTVREDIPAFPANGTIYYARVSLSSTGSRTIQWQTTHQTKDRKYTIHAERGPPGPNGLPDIFSTVTKYSTAEVGILVEKGAVTIVAGGNHGLQEPDEDTLPATITSLPTLPTPSLPLSAPETTIAPLNSPSPVVTPPSTRASGFGFWIGLAGLIIVSFITSRRS